MIKTLLIGLIGLFSSKKADQMRRQSLYRKACRILIKNERSFLHTSGWVRSLAERKPCDANGDGVPWMNYAVISFLKERLHKDLSLFEYGSGFSTRFYARHVGQVDSVEHNANWYEQVRRDMPDNVRLQQVLSDEDGDYCRAIHTHGKIYDVVVIDGRDRNHCLSQAITALTPSGVILVDDSDQDYTRDGIAHAKRSGFRTLSFEGFKGTDDSINCTAILYRSDNCLGL